MPTRRWVIEPETMADPDMILTCPDEFGVEARRCVSPAQYVLRFKDELNELDPELVERVEQVATRDAIWLTCRVCGSDWPLPPAPHSWQELLCLRGCNWPKNEREARRMIGVASMTPGLLEARLDALAPKDSAEPQAAP